MNNKRIGLVSRVDYPVRVRKTNGNMFILPPKKKTKKEFSRESVNVNELDPREVTVIR